MPEQLPNGWVRTTLGEIVEPSRERVLPAEVPAMPYVGLEHIQPQTMRLLGHENAREVRSSSVRFSKGDVLYGKLRPYLNKVWVAEFDGLCSAEFLVFPKCEGLNSQFLAARLNAEDFVNFANGQVSGERPRVGFEKLSSFSIMLPPTAEQQRIIDRLNAALSGLERAGKVSRRALERLQRYRAAVLRAAVTGKLTRAWRQTQQNNVKGDAGTGQALPLRLLAARRTTWEKAESERLRAIGNNLENSKWKSRYREPISPDAADLPELPKGWFWVSVDQVASGQPGAIQSGPFGSQLLHSEFVDRGILAIGIDNVLDGTFSLGLQHRITPQKYDSLKKFTANPLDVVVTVMSTVGRVCVLPENLELAIITKHCYRITPAKDWVEPEYLSIALRADAPTRRHIFGHIRGQTRPGINGKILKAAPLGLPPVAEQLEIIHEVGGRLSLADHLATRLQQQLTRAGDARSLLLRDAFSGRLVPQSPTDDPASLLLERIRVEKARKEAERKEAGQSRQLAKESKGVAMKQPPPSIETLRGAWEKHGIETGARRLFDEAGYAPSEVVQFYEALRAIPELRAAFEQASPGSSEQQQPIMQLGQAHEQSKGHFRLIELWLEDFKNLKGYTVRFDRTQSLDVILGWNGTGKSNLFEALIIIFRDLHDWWEKNHWPDTPMNGFRLSYEMGGHIVEVTWRPGQMKRPDLKRGASAGKETGESSLEPIRREDLPLPRFVFGYYSGPTNRLAEHFLPMKQAHYDRLREATADDPETLARLLEQRRFFCAESYQAKYVLLWFLLGFSYREDPEISEFLANRLRIVGFESVLFIIRKPRWAKAGSKAENFWDATGVMRLVMERLRRHAIAPMILKQKVSYGYRSSTEDHYYFFLPDLKSLHSFAAAYQDAQTFFMALESTDFSELIHDVKIQVRVKASKTEEVSITFHQLSEGEQQLLMVLGLMRFTKSHQSLVLLDEPDTHLNPQWSVGYLKDLAQAMSDNALGSTEQQTSQILIATHDPLVIASLVKEQVHLLKRDVDTLRCYWEQAAEDPRGLGFTGILTSEMFGFRSDLDSVTLDLLDKQVDLAGKETLSQDEAGELESITQRVEKLGFKSASSDPYYRAFIRAVVSRQRVRDLFLKPTLTKPDFDVLQRETTEILAELEAEEEKRK
ncbi:MAG: AAA family ATPase [Terriglobia bacterium]